VGGDTDQRLLAPEKLYRHCDTTEFRFKTTAELPDLSQAIGQDRAIEAIRFGVSIQQQGFNLFLLGPTGTGKYELARHFLAGRAAKAPIPDDWCYVHNFEKPEQPRALGIPHGRGAVLREDMHGLLENLKSAIPAAFETESYRARKQVIEQEVKLKEEKTFEQLQDEASQKDIAVIRTPTGFVLAPGRGNEVISPEEFRFLAPSWASSFFGFSCQVRRKKSGPKSERNARPPCMSARNEVLSRRRDRPRRLRKSL
jgi:hypothetical protein